MDLASWFKNNPDWRPYADLVALPPKPEELMQWFPDVSSEVLARCCELVNECGMAVSRGTIYTRVRREKEDGDHTANSDRWATMLCLQSPPRLKTNVTFLSGRKPWHELADPRYVEKVRKRLAEKGISLTPNMEYMPELARYTGDPEAVLPHGQERDHIKNICERRGWACEGAVECKHREPDRDPIESAPKMAEDLIRNKARLLVQDDPSLKRKSTQEIRAAVLQKFGPTS